MGIEEKLPSGVLLTTVEGVAGYMRKSRFAALKRRAAQSHSRPPRLHTYA